MRIITAQEVAASLPWKPLVERLATTFREGVESPPRHHHAMHRPDGEATMLLMPAWEREGYIGVKMVNVFPQNAEQGLPAIAGVYLLSEGAHGRPLACIDGSELTRRRTAAASALAARELAREDAECLLVVGTGKLAPMVIEAHAAVRPIRRVRIWGRNAEKARRLAAEYADRFDATIMLDPEGYVAEASAANVFLLRDGVLHTPEVTSCLQGITRDSVIRLAREVLGIEVRERRITRDELYTADEAFVTGTAAEVLPLRELDGRHIGGRAGAPAVGEPIAADSLTARLQRLYRRVACGELDGELEAFRGWLTPAGG